VQLNEPAELVVKALPALQLLTVTPSKTSPTALDTEKPVPATVTVAPIGPWFGVTVMVGIVTVNACAVVDLPVATSCPTTL
jgi:hypothetical protein